MRRAIARGRVFPQGYSTDRRYGRLSLNSIALFPLMWSNADDQGRLSGDPEEIKYTCCPNIDYLTKANIPAALQDLQNNKLIKIYKTSDSTAIQLLDWWDPVLGQRPQWAYPSQFAPPDGWVDRLRYHPIPTEIITQNWVPPGQWDRSLPSELGSTTKGGLPRKLRSTKKKLPQTPTIEKGNRKGKMEEGEGKVPSALGSSSRPRPSVMVLTDRDKKIYEILKENYCNQWGRLLPPDYVKVEPRKLQAKAGAQLRDLGIELSASGVDPDLMIIKQAFGEAAAQQKYSISYVRAILFNYLGIKRNRSP